MPVKLNGRMFNTGDNVTLNNRARHHIPGVSEGLTVEIHIIRAGQPPVVGLYSPGGRIDGWADLDGNVSSRRGWWISTEELELCVHEGAGEYEVTKSFEHRGVQLKGKACKHLVTMHDGTVFVEFDEDVNGCSADGLGKAGHCVALDRKILKIQDKKKKVKHSK